MKTCIERFQVPQKAPGKLRCLGGQKGFLLIEVLVAVLLLSIASLSILQSTLMSYKTVIRNQRNSLAQQIALEKMEELAAENPANLGDGFDATEAELVYDSVPFTRVTDVTVNADNSRSVVVTVLANETSLGGTATLSNNFALWGTY